MSKFLDENGLKVVKQHFDAKQDTLVSGENIKTVGGQNILGSGDLPIDVEAMTSQDIADAVSIAIADPILNNNSWDVIAAICAAGKAARAGWQLGDIKTDVGTDGVTRTFRICDMQGLYGKHVVFEQVELEATNYEWNITSNVDSDNCYNNYSISEMRTTHLPAILLKYSNELQSSITNTTYKVATNGNNGTLLELTDKLFLPAEREIITGHSWSRNEESNALTTYTLYETNNTATFRKKYKSGATDFSRWWFRSPSSDSISDVGYVNYDGYMGSKDANTAYAVAPFFSF